MAGFDVNLGGSGSTLNGYKSRSQSGYNYTHDAKTGQIDIDMSDFDSKYKPEDYYVEDETGKAKFFYYYKDAEGNKKARYVNSADDAPVGAEIYSIYGVSKPTFTGKHGTGKNGQAKAKKEKEDEYRRRLSSVQSEINAQLSENRDKAERERQAQAKATEIANNNKLLSEQEKANQTSFQNMLSDESYDLRDSVNKQYLITPEVLVKKAREEKIPYEKVLSSIKGTKWEKDEKLIQAELDKIYPEEERDLKRKRIWDAYKEQNPDAKFSDFAQLYANNDASLNDAISYADKKDADAIAEKERIAQEQADKDAKKVAELEEQAKTAKEESDKRIADAEAEKLAREFEKKYPIPIAQFWNPNWDLKKKIMLLGELLANMGSNITRGALEGFHGRTSQAEVSPTAQYFRNALQQQGDRNALVNTESAKSQANAERRDAILRNLPKLSTLGNKAFQKVSLLLEGQKPSKDEFVKLIKELEPFRDEKEIIEMYEEFGRGRTSYIEGSENYAAQLGNDVTEINKDQMVIENFLKNEKEVDAWIQALMKERTELENIKKRIKDEKQEDFWKSANYVMNYVAGVQTYSSSIANSRNTSNHRSGSSSDNGGVNANAGNGIIGLGANIGTQSSKSSSNATNVGYNDVSSSQINVLQKANLPVGLQNGKAFIEDTEENRRKVEKSIQDQIDYIDNELLPQAERIRQTITGATRVPKVNDGIIKSPHQKQWIVREDGSKIELNPDDNVYATLNDITTDKDKGQNVVQMSKADAITVMKNLGYDGQKPIIKDFNYYLTKLKR